MWICRGRFREGPPFLGKKIGWLDRESLKHDQGSPLRQSMGPYLWKYMHPPLIFVTINTQQILSNHLCPCITPMSELLKTMNWLHCPNFFADKLRKYWVNHWHVILLRYNVKLPSPSHTVKPSLSKPFERFWLDKTEGQTCSKCV